MNLDNYREKIANFSEEELNKRDKYLSDLMNGKLSGPVTGYLSIDKPQFRVMEAVDYDKNASRRTVYDVACEKVLKYINEDAMNYYGKIISNKELIKEWDKATKGYQNIGVMDDKIVLFMGLNTPEVTYSLYAVNRLGGVSEWFNPNTLTPQLLKEHIINNNVETIFTIDVAYDLVKKAIEGTGVKTVVVNSVMDSFPLDMRLKYMLQVFGINKIIKSNVFEKKIREIKEKINYYEDNREMTYSKEKLESLSQLEKQIFNLFLYSKKEKIEHKASFYLNNKDDRFITWEEFIKRGEHINDIKEVPYKEGKTTFIVHTGGTTGPSKRVAHTDYSANSALYQASFLPIDFQPGDKIAQIIPPMVAWGLEAILVARYFGMTSEMIATYDRNEFVPFILKSKANHYFTVPSFVETILDNPMLDGVDLDFIKSINYGGEAMPGDKERRIDDTLKEHNCKIKGYYGFGQNEEFGCSTLNVTIPGKEKKYGTCGIPIVGNEFLLLDEETGKEVRYGRDENGEYQYGDLYITGPTMMEQYIGTAESENEKTIKYYFGKKYLKTGDRTYIDEFGRTGDITRAGRIIRTQEGKIFTTILETILSKIPEIEESIVVASPHPSKVQEASCHIVLREEYRSPEIMPQVIEKVIKEVEEETSKMYTYYTPGTYEFRNTSLPRTSSMDKKDFKALEEMNKEEYANNEGRPLRKVRIR